VVGPGERVLGRYVIEGLLGEGGMGKVYRAHHATLGLAVAVKVMHRQERPDLVERFEREAQLMSRVQHPNVVRVLDYGLLDDGAPCLVMEVLEGESLETRLVRRVSLPWREALSLERGLLEGLGAIHAAGVVHRDLKPSNVFLARGDQGSEVLKLIDFGIARPIDDGPKLTRAGQILGTPEYMAPEQLLGTPADFRSDIYTAALLLYEMLSGQLPYVTDDLSELLMRVGNPAPVVVVPGRMPRPPREVIDVLMGALALDAKARPVTAGELAAQLDTAVEAAAMGNVQELRVGRATGVPTPTPGETTPEARVVATRYLFAARLPPSRLAKPEERRFLTGLTMGSAKGYTMGAQFWFALKTAPAPPDEAMEAAESLSRALTERYGSTARSGYRMVEPTFALTAAALSGAVPLPETLRALLDELTHDR
jgi:serine/threonine-protein kinase